ncbi:MGDG synthase family glycosyltransferase [Actinomycetospora chiangmaiensis]|uniref:MGDG synthase family glycosyltransferase n=1 Tax=Actinomycetospora chiangmaiensis TaxID=402650 RepID=UPI00146A40A1|nr:glycosyltransferase [Actinomycetospora chiangmaiensis]
MIVSGNIGEGHQSAAHAVAESLESVWPGCRIEIVESFAAVGVGSGPILRWLYRVAVGSTPGLQQLWYRAVSRCSAVRWFYGRVVGGWVARALAPRIAAGDPDAVLSTYPLATAGLARLRRAGTLTVPVTAVLCDVAPHAFWVYDGVDHYVVVDDEGAERMLDLAPDQPVTVVGPLVRRAFRTTPAASREQWDLPADAFVVLVSAGSMALGGLTEAVTAALASDERCIVVALCGRDHRTRLRLERLARSAPRLRVLGWVDEPAALTAVADVVVNNSGGVTAQEALACGRPLVMFRPLAGHGRDSAAVLARSGVAECCASPRCLTRVLRSLARDPAVSAAAQSRATRYAARHDLDELARTLAVGPSRGSRRLGHQHHAAPAATTATPVAAGSPLAPDRARRRAEGAAPTPAENSGPAAGRSADA